MRKLYFFVAVLLGLAVVNVAFITPTATSNADTAIFDHNQCQYPYRTTNPPEGCDNSDPCDVLSAAKGGSGECLPQPTTVEPQTAPVTPVETPKSVPQQSGCKL